MQFHVTHMTKSERIAEFLFSTTNWWKVSWINHICSFILYHSALSTLTVVRERWTVSGLIQEEWPEMKLLLSSAIVNGGSVQANSSLFFQRLDSEVQWRLISWTWTNLARGQAHLLSRLVPDPDYQLNTKVPLPLLGDLRTEKSQMTLCVHKFSISSFEKQREHLKYHFFFGYLIFLL